jgi:hypothetical protein
MHDALFSFFFVLELCVFGTSCVSNFQVERRRTSFFFFFLRTLPFCLNGLLSIYIQAALRNAVWVLREGQRKTSVRESALMERGLNTISATQLN